MACLTYCFCEDLRLESAVLAPAGHRVTGSAWGQTAAHVVTCPPGRTPGRLEMTSASPLSRDETADVIEQDRGIPRWLCAAASAATVAITIAAVAHAALPAHRALGPSARAARATQPLAHAAAAGLPWNRSGFGGLPARYCPADGLTCWPRQPYGAAECALPASLASVSGPAEALLVRLTRRYSVSHRSACR